MKRVYLFIGIIFILLIVGGLLLWQKTVKAPANPPATPTPQPMPPISKTPAGWKTYENEEFGFAFDYPGDWKMQRNKEVLKEYAPLEISFYSQKLGGTIDVLVLSRKFNPNNIIFNTGSMQGTIQIKKENAWQNLRIVDVDSQKGYRFFGAAGDCGGDFMQTPMKNLTLQIGFINCVEDVGITDNIKNSVISSLKFIK